jgi:L-malate glycosyltransferase
MPEPISVSYIISSITTGLAGTEGHLLRLMRNLDRERFTPQLIVLQKTEWSERLGDELEPGIPLTTLGFESFKKPSSWKTLTNLVRHFRATKTKIVELFFTDAHFVGSLAARVAGVPIVISSRRNLGYQYGKKELRLSRFGNRFVTLFVANSKAVANQIAEIEGISRRDFEIIHNGVDIEKFDREMQRDIPANLKKFIEGKKVVMLSANLRPIKNVQGFLMAGYQIVAERNDTVFVILGSGPDESSLQSLAAELGIADRVYWAGSVDVPALYLACADVCCLSSDSEGFSNSIVEYMAAGKPVVATRVGGAGECIDAGESGFLVGRGDFNSMAKFTIRLLDDPQMCQSFGAAGRRIVEERFTLERQMQRYHDMYDTLLGRR